jgi:hypothetical protein
MKILELPKQFRISTNIIYPPFKNGKYMEEYFYDYMIKHSEEIESEWIYIPVFWTNLQNHSGFKNMRVALNIILKEAYSKYPSSTRFFTVVQHDDGPMLLLPPHTLVFGACIGDIPLPLIYEDRNCVLQSYPKVALQDKTYLATFIGSSTHPIRKNMTDILRDKSDIVTGLQKTWTNSISKSSADLFIDTTIKSKFCLAPRGYGRSSFRFFESMQLGVIPVYFWDDKEWLPYKEFLDYSKFSVSIHSKDIHNTYNRLKIISNEIYLNMLQEMTRVREWFTLEGMARYILWKLDEKSGVDVLDGWRAE